MQSKKQLRNLIFRTMSHSALTAILTTILFALTVVLTHSVQAQTFQVIYNFTGGVDGGEPAARPSDGCCRKSLWNHVGYRYPGLWHGLSTGPFRLWLGLDSHLSLRRRQ